MIVNGARIISLPCSKMNLPCIQFAIGTSEVRLKVKPILIKGRSYDSINFRSNTIVLVQIEIRDSFQEIITTIPFRQCSNQSELAARLWRPFVYVSHGLALRPLYFRSMEVGNCFIELQDFVKEPLASPWSQQNRFISDFSSAVVSSAVEPVVHSLGNLINLIISAFLLGDKAWNPNRFIYHTDDFFGALTLQQINEYRSKCEGLGLGLKLEIDQEELGTDPGFRPRYKFDSEDPKYLNLILMANGVLFPHYREVSRRTPMDALFVETHRLLQDLGERIVMNFSEASSKSAQELFLRMKYYRLAKQEVRECFSGTGALVLIYG